MGCKKKQNTGCLAPLVLLFLFSAMATSWSEAVDGTIALTRAVLFFAAGPLLYVTVVLFALALVWRTALAIGLPRLFSLKDFAWTAKELELTQMALAELDACKITIAEIREKGKDLSTRKDGLFSERSNLGRELNPKLLSARKRRGLLESKLNQLDSYRDRRTTKYIQVKRSRNVIVSAIFVFLICFFIGYGSETPPLTTLSTGLSSFSPLPDNYNSPSLMAGLFSGVSMALLVYWLGGKLWSDVLVRRLKWDSRLSRDEQVVSAEALAKRFKIGEWSGGKS